MFKQRPGTVTSEVASLVQVGVYGLDPGEQPGGFTDSDLVNLAHPRERPQLRSAFLDPVRQNPVAVDAALDSVQVSVLRNKTLRVPVTVHPVSLPARTDNPTGVPGGWQYGGNQTPRDALRTT